MSEDFDGFEYHRSTLRMLIWSGFFNEADLNDHMADLEYDDDAKPHLHELRNHAMTEMAAKREAEAAWQHQTDWDRLDKAFTALNSKGVLALHNAGYTTKDAHDDAWDIIQGSKSGRWRGFVFYHGQDVERAVEGYPLYLGFDAVAEAVEAKLAIGSEIVEAIRDAGFELEWNSDPETRPHIPNFEWKKRTQWQLPENPAPADGSGKKPQFWQRLFGRG